jgi:predicted RNase H-like nuclease (RuvC/YqgF family)
VGAVSLGGAASIATVVVALLALTGVLGISFRSARGTQILRNAEAVADSWRERADAMEVRANARDEAIKELQDKLAERDREISLLQGKILTLEEMVTGRSAIEELARQFQQRNVHMSERVTEALMQINAIRGDVRQNYDLLLSLVREDDSRERPGRPRQAGSGSTPAGS